MEKGDNKKRRIVAYPGLKTWSIPASGRQSPVNLECGELSPLSHVAERRHTRKTIRQRSNHTPYLEARPR